MWNQHCIITIQSPIVFLESERIVLWIQILWYFPFFVFIESILWLYFDYAALIFHRWIQKSHISNEYWSNYFNRIAFTDSLHLIVVGEWRKTREIRNLRQFSVFFYFSSKFTPQTPQLQKHAEIHFLPNNRGNPFSAIFNHFRPFSALPTGLPRWPLRETRGNPFPAIFGKCRLF